MYVGYAESLASALMQVNKPAGAAIRRDFFAREFPAVTGVKQGDATFRYN